MEDKVHENRHRRVNGERVDRRHVRQGSNGKATDLGAGAEQDRGTHLAHRLANVLLNVVFGFVRNAVVGVHKDENVVDTDGQDEEGDYLREREGEELFK